MKKVLEYLKNFNKFIELNTPITHDNCTHDTVFKSDDFQLTFFKELSDADLKKLAEAANFMDIPSLLDSCCAAIAIKFKQAQIAYSKDMGYTEEQIKYLPKPMEGDEELDKVLQKEYAYALQRPDEDDDY